MSTIILPTNSIPWRTQSAFIPGPSNSMPHTVRLDTDDDLEALRALMFLI
jgi:hypothetical protein